MLTKTTILDYQPLQPDMVLIYFVRKPVLTTGYVKNGNWELPWGTSGMPLKL